MQEVNYGDIDLYIDGRWLKGGGDGEDIVNPASGEGLARLSHASAADLDHALDSTAKAYLSWRRQPATVRGGLLRKVAECLRARAEGIATRLTIDQGKPLAEARAEVLAAAEVFEWCAEECRRVYGRVIPARRAEVRQAVTYEPIGPAAVFSPWNFPIVLSARKVAAALAAGCTVILKAAEETPSGPAAIASACAEAGVPPGVLSLVFGRPAFISEHLLSSMIIRKVSFTGSVSVGKRIAALAARNLQRCTLELGGHAAVIVAADADPEESAQTLAAAKFRNAGQVCVAPSRFYVHDSIYDCFLNRFVEFAEALRPGDGLLPQTTMGPLATARQRAGVRSIVDEAVGRGASRIENSVAVPERGYFLAPTVLTEVPDEALVMTQEPFGPVAPIVRFGSLREVIDRANRLHYGLAAFVFTSSLRTAAELSEALEVGMIGVNHTALGLPETPVCGIKDSGYGHEGGTEGVREYLSTKFVTELVR